MMPPGPCEPWSGEFVRWRDAWLAGLSEEAWIDALHRLSLRALRSFHLRRSWEGVCADDALRALFHALAAAEVTADDRGRWNDTWPEDEFEAILAVGD